MKGFVLIILISILAFINSGDLGSNTSINDTNYKDKITDIYKQLLERLTTIYHTYFDRFLNPPDYDFHVTEVLDLKECVEDSMGSKQPCILVDLDMKNKQNDAITIEITTRTIVTKDGKQLEKYGGLYNTRQLNVLCDTPNFFKLFPKANKSVGICFPQVTREDKPVMYVNVLANGNLKEHSFDLTSLIDQ